MSELKLNNTPVRTSRNFGINNIKLEDVSLMDKLTDFENVDIMIDECENVLLSHSISNYELKYGVGKELEEEVKSKANQTLKFDIKNEAKIEIDFNFDEESLNLVDNIEIVANEGSNSSVIVKYSSLEGTNCYHNGTIRIFTKNGSKLNLTFINLMNDSSTNFISIQSEISEGAEVKYTSVDFGGKESITNYYSNLERKRFKELYKYDLFRKKRATI